MKHAGATVLAFDGKTPRLGDGVFLAPGARVIGDVLLGPAANVWFNAVLRGDMQAITIGARTNIQDNAVIHVTFGTGPTHIGQDVTVGHSAVIHACTVADLCLIGMGAVLLDGAYVDTESIVGAGAVVTPGKRFPPRSLIVGSPARVARSVSEEEVARLRHSAERYVEFAARTAQMVRASEVLG